MKHLKAEAAGMTGKDSLINEETAKPRFHAAETPNALAEANAETDAFGLGNLTSLG